MANRDGGPAFPQAHTYESLDHLKPGEIGYPVKVTAVASGMTLRDHFASKAMDYLLRTHQSGWPNGLSSGSVSGAAYELADAMLHARESSNGQ